METYHGHVRTPADAILLFEACRVGLLPRVQRRLSEKERQQITSGSVFVWDEREAGMRRWTDGKSWSASRVSGSFLTYREMEGKRGGNGYTPPAQAAKRPSGKTPDSSKDGDSDEGPDGYRYKPDGLMKQSFSITTSSGQHLHLISYYSRSHPAAVELKQPTQDPSLRHIRPPKNMYPESTVNETTTVPAVTRGPMPGSPYAPTPIQMPMGSAYNARPQPTAFIPAGGAWPPTPGATPPYHAQYSYYPPQAPVLAHPVMYAPYAHHPHAQAVYDRGAPVNSNLSPPPPSHYMVGHHPQYAPHPSYIQNPPPRPIEAAPAPPTQPNGHPGGQHVDPQLAQQGPQLPAINGAASTPSSQQGKPASPQPTESRSSNTESLAVPESNGTTANAASPARTIPSVGALLNGHPSESTQVKGDQSNSRSGSRSPNGAAQRDLREIPGDRLQGSSTSADKQALSKLNKVMLMR